MRAIFLATSVALIAYQVGAHAQTPTPAAKPLVLEIASHPDWPKAASADVDSVDHLVTALYDVISGPTTKQRDWIRFRSLFLPDGRLGPIRPASPPSNDKPAQAADVFFLTPEMYAERVAPRFKREGFFERGIASRVEEFGNLVHVWTTYESRHAESDSKPFARGVNSIQLVNAAGRYWIASIMWDQEREGLTLPDKYLTRTSN